MEYQCFWAAQKDFIQTFQLPVVQGDTEGSFIPFHKHFSPALGTILSEHKNISEYKEGALYLAVYHQYDWNFYKMIGYMMRLEGSVKDDNGELTMVASLPCNLLIKVGHKVMIPTFKGVFGTILNMQTAREFDTLLGTRVAM